MVVEKGKGEAEEKDTVAVIPQLRKLKTPTGRGHNGRFWDPPSRLLSWSSYRSSTHLHLIVYPFLRAV